MNVAEAKAIISDLATRAAPPPIDGNVGQRRRTGARAGLAVMIALLVLGVLMRLDQHDQPVPPLIYPTDYRPPPWSSPLPTDLYPMPTDLYPPPSLYPLPSVPLPSNIFPLPASTP